MNCRACGNINHDSANYCTKCGNQLHPGLTGAEKAELDRLRLRNERSKRGCFIVIGIIVGIIGLIIFIANIIAIMA